MTTTVTTRRITGLKPTGYLHLGNLLGAIQPMVRAQYTSDSIVFLADLHALTVAHEPRQVRERTLEQATVLLAAGLDPDRVLLYVQSHVPAHTELHYLLECATGYGEAQRMIQFKEKAGAQAQVRVSLLTYPCLMAADILLHDAREVPVGDDQRQHVELTRDVAERFNARYGDDVRRAPGGDARGRRPGDGPHRPTVQDGQDVGVRCRAPFACSTHRTWCGAR